MCIVEFIGLYGWSYRQIVTSADILQFSLSPLGGMLTYRIMKKDVRRQNEIILRFTISHRSFCDKIVTTQSLAFVSYWYRKKRLQVHF